MVSLVAQLALTALMLSTGSLNTISKKIMYQTEGWTIDPEVRQKYQRPWFCTFIMFCGEAMCMLFFYLFALYYKWSDRKKTEYSPKGQISDMTSVAEGQSDKVVFVSREEVKGDPTGGLGWRFPLYAALFASCDLMATSLTGIGLMYCNASVVQILRGFVIVFTMLFAWAFLKRKPKFVQVLGVLFAICGLVLVGVSAIMIEKDAAKTEAGHSVADTILGLGLTLLSQVFSAIQFVFEEKLLKQNSHKVGPIPPLFLVGAEGIAGAVLTMGVALPIANSIPGTDFGCYENLENSVYMMFHNPLVLALQLIYFGSISFFNWSSFVYSKALSATARTLVDACRTIVVWIVMVSVFYACPGQGYGEPVAGWSVLQVCGFIGMMIGTTTHNNIGGFGDWITSCCRKPDNELINDTPLVADEDK